MPSPSTSSAVLESSDPDLLLVALGDIARSEEALAQVAKDTGLGREPLYSACAGRASRGSSPS